ncbi:hypothetical protein D9M70_303240 [compost metagenome]
MAELEGLAAVADEQLHVPLQGALVHTEYPELAHERVDHHLEHVGDHVLLRVRLGAEGLGLGPLALEKQRRVALRGVGRQARQHLQQLGDPGPGARGGEAQGNQMALAQCPLEGLVQLGRGDLALFQVARHQLLVHLDHLVHQGLVRVGHRGEVGLAVRLEEAIDDPAGVVRRQVQRQHLLAEGFPQAGEQAGQVHPLGVDLVHHQHAAKAALGGHGHHAAGGQFDAVLRIDHHQRGFHRRQGGDGLADEVRVAGGIDQVQLGAGMAAVGQRRGEGMTVFALQGIEVAHRVAALQAAGYGNSAAALQQRLGQAGLAAVAMADQGDRSNGFHRVVRHEYLRALGCFQYRQAPRACRKPRLALVFQHKLLKSLEK